MIDMSAENIQKEFSQNGFVIVEGLLDVNLDLQPLVADYASLLDQLAVVICLQTTMLPRTPISMHMQQYPLAPRSTVLLR